ncbi:hypothetical protein [Saccharothrix variisporea]|uniref:Uncharacterized protein n=1 Tax=Saccharothrix variisporea TaxID=543527 RepID=A0A495X4B4_9PSEU|nr:hypothetical protein [Saccharothrix variisporea]RKT68359.1 hypothetical protein DFJ66_1542 [Saccharothrix variisporea]
MRVALVVAVVAVLALALAPRGYVVRYAQVKPPLPAAGLKLKYKVDGVNRVAKLQSDLVIGPGTLETEIDLITGDLKGDLTLPPSNGYFIVFGFMPNTARVDLIPTAQVVGKIAAGQIKANSQLHIKLSEVHVNGQPLDVGPDCKTATPASIDLEGPFDLAKIPMKATFTIPPFAGCQGAEKLDPLFSGLISGPDNKLEMTLTAQF